MRINQIIQIERYLSLIGAAGLLAWWFLMPVLLPVSDSADSFQQMVLDNNWVSLNILGLVSTILMTLGYPGFYLAKHNTLNKTGFVGLMITCVGLILFTAIQYYETFLWPVAARVNPELLEVKGALVGGDAGIVAGLIISGIFLGLGYVLFGISSLKTKAYPKIPIWFLIIGAPVFGNGIIFPVRTVGLVLFCAGTIMLSLKARKSI